MTFGTSNIFIFKVSPKSNWGDIEKRFHIQVNLVPVFFCQNLDTSTCENFLAVGCCSLSTFLPRKRGVFRFKLEKIASKTLRLLKMVYEDKAVGPIQVDFVVS